MCRFVFYLLFSLTASLVHLQATAAVSPEVDEVVNQSLSHGMGYPEIIASLTAHPFNLSLENATAMAIEAGGDSHAEAFAAAGIAAAASLPQAESVAAAAKAASGQTSAAADAAVGEYIRLMDQPYIHHDGTIPTGGGVRPPVSPDS